MICVYPADCTDFSNNGLGSVSPSSCTVTETLNGEYELKLVHPLDESGKWKRLTEGAILRAPVPAGITPKLHLSPHFPQGSAVYRVSTRRDPLRLRSGTGTKYRILAKYKKGTEVTVLEKTTAEWYEVTCSDGKRGYMSAQYLTFIRAIPKPSVPDDTMENRPLRDQPFRIYRVVPELDQITVSARHIFYDLIDNMIQSFNPSSSAAGASVVHGIGSRCKTEHDFTFYSDLTSTADEVEFVNVNPVDALLGNEGVVEKYGGELARDWFDVYVVERVGVDKDVQIREGKNLLGIQYDVDMTNVTTRIMPTGTDKDGELLYLPELFLDSPNIDRYIHPKWMHLAVAEAREVTRGDDKKSRSQCYKEMRKAAQDAFDEGCDLPDVTLKVDFVNCVETEKYKQYKFLQNIFLGDSVRVIARRIGVEVSMRMTQYTYDCLTRKYTDMTLGNAADALEGSTISGRQIPSGSVTGSKLAIHSVGQGQIQNGAVGSLQIQMAAIQTAHIEEAAITSALIAKAVIQTAHIADAQITAAKIQDASITAAQIAQATITSAQIAKATITEAEIKDAAITAAKIALATITSAQIAEAAIKTANIDDLAVTSAKIENAAITSAKIDEAAIQSAHIEDAAITHAKIALLAVDEANIADLAVTTAKIANAAIKEAQIDNLAVTSAKIHDAAITSAKIQDAAIGTAQIALGAITSALIEQGAVGTAQIADASITDAKIVDLSADRINAGTLSVERLVIVGSDKSIVFAINQANGTPQLSQTTIDGGALTERTITADRIVAGAITAKEIASDAILANHITANAVTSDKIAAGSVDASKIKANTITANLVSSDFGEMLNLSSNKGIHTTVTQTVDSAIESLEVGGVNLISDSADHLLTAEGSDSYWLAADELQKGRTYTFSVQEVIQVSGTAPGIAWQAVNQETEDIYTGGQLDVTYGRQTIQFTLPDIDANWAFYLYAGLHRNTQGVAVRFIKAKLEEGSFATTWTPSPEDDAAALNRVENEVNALNDGMDQRVQKLIDAMGLSDKFASSQEFLDALKQIEAVRSEVAQHDSDLSLTFNRLQQAVGSITQIFSSFVFGDDNGIPYLDMSASASSVKMRLTNTRLAFVQSGKEMAYFSDNKLYVTRLEVVEQVSIGTQSNGYLDIVTTPIGVGFKWRE